MAVTRLSTARSILWPNNSNVLVRVAFLYVGQGASAVVFAANGNGYDVLLVDTNLDTKNGGIDIPKLMTDLLDGQSLHAFVNTHPHDDHLCGTQKLSDAVVIDNVWHSGHIPSKKFGSKHPELTALIAKVKKKGGKEILLEGSRSALPLGNAFYHVLSPAVHVTDDVNEEEADIRYRRIHEQCGVLKFGNCNQWIMITGDADRAAFENHITNYHKERLGAFALGGSHHGSRTFFRETEEDEPYLAALTAIDPTYVIISAPKQNESKHDHPHDDALELYEAQVGVGNVLHMGADRMCFIFDINKDGTVSGGNDGGQLAQEYGLCDEKDSSTKTEGMGGFIQPAVPAVVGQGRWA